MLRPGRSGRHRAPAGFAKYITPFVLIALCLGAIFTIGWSAVEYLLTPHALSTVATVPQESFVPQYPTVSLAEAPLDDKECQDFFDQDDAQKYYVAHGGPKVDPDDLDLDNDGQACENYRYSVSTSTLVPSQETEPNDQQS